MRLSLECARNSLSSVAEISAWQNLPTPIKFQIVYEWVSFYEETHQYKQQSRSLAWVSLEFAILYSMSLTRWMIEHNHLPNWINLPGTHDFLSIQYYKSPLVVLRKDTRSPDLIFRTGFRRRGIPPQFLPHGCHTLEEYEAFYGKLKGGHDTKNTPSIQESTPTQADIQSSEEAFLSEEDAENQEDTTYYQVPWHTMISTFPVSDENYQKAVEFDITTNINEETNLDEIDTLSGWIYFMAVYHGVKTRHHFHEIATLGILSADIVGAVQIDEEGNALSYEFNQDHCCLFKQHEETGCVLKNSILALFTNKKKRKDNLQTDLPKAKFR